jgi:hypothetical protein
LHKVKVPDVDFLSTASNDKEVEDVENQLGIGDPLGLAHFEVQEVLDVVSLKDV